MLSRAHAPVRMIPFRLEAAEVSCDTWLAGPWPGQHGFKHAAGLFFSFFSFEEPHFLSLDTEQ